MQQTENHKLNLIEPGDPFSPDALNENTQAIDAVLTRFACGAYTGDGKASLTVELPFTPRVVFVTSGGGHIYRYDGYQWYYGGLATPGRPAKGSSYTLVEIVENGFTVYNQTERASSNVSGNTYNYFAVG